MKKKYNFLANLFMYLTIIVFSIISVIFLITSNAFLFLIAFLILVWISIKNNIKHFPILLFVLCFLIRIIAILFLNFPQVSDFKILLDASINFSHGDYSFQKISYFATWAYQTGFVVYQGLILKLFSNPIILKILNGIYSSVLCVLIYIFSKKISSEKSARLSSLLYMIFPYQIYMNSVMANHHIATFLTYIGILFLLKKEAKIKDYIIAAILISFGNIMRPEGIIVICSLILFELFKLKKETIKDVLKKLLIFLTIYLLIGSLSSFIIKKTNINKTGLSNNDPLWKFVLGFNHEKCGYYDDNDVYLLQNKEEELKVIKERLLVNPVKMAKLMSCKTTNFWLQSDLKAKNEMYMNKKINIMNQKINFTDIENIILKFNEYLYIITFLMCIIGVIFNRKKVIESEAVFFVILMIVTFFVYLLIEIQPRYAYFIHVSIFVLSTYGYDYMLNLIDKKLKKRRIN